MKGVGTLGYSKITEVEIANFMAFEHAKFVFDESGVINLKGYNNSGKSACIRAMVVCLMNLWENKQAKFIQNNKDFFRVRVSFDDGISIVRDKYINGQSLYEMYKGKELVFSTKQGKSLTKVSGVPDVIKDYLALCPIETGYLNYQSCKDPLLLIDTTGSTNYNNFHEVLKIEQISRANALINSDKNEASSTVSSIEARIQEQELQLEELSGITEELIEALEQRDDLDNALQERFAEILRTDNVVEQLGGLTSIPEVKKISTSRLQDIEEVQSTAAKLESLKEIPKIDKVDPSRLRELIELNSMLVSLSKLGSSSYPEVPKVSEVGVHQLKELATLSSTLVELVHVEKDLKEIQGNLKEARKRAKTIVEEARTAGYVFAKCSNCGTYMNIKVGKTGGD